MSTIAKLEPDVLHPNDVLEPLGPPLAEAEAKKLDNRLSYAVKSATNSLHSVTERVTEAKRGQIHVALGFPSWTAYLSDRLAPLCAALTGENRREVVALLADEGMSLRAIGQATGTSKDTVARDLAAVSAHQVSRNETPDNEGDQGDADDQWPAAPAKVTGLDGKTQTRTKRKAGPPPDPFAVAFERKADDVRKAALKLVALTSDKRVSDAERSRLGDALHVLDMAIASLTEVRKLFPPDGCDQTG